MKIGRYLAALMVAGLCIDRGHGQEVDLESTFQGDKEQPSVSFFMPWDPTGGPDKLYRPIRTISGNVLEPVDREVLLRRTRFYQQLALETRATAPASN